MKLEHIEALRILIARHGRENGQSKKFYDGAVFGYRLALAIESGDKTRLAGMRHAEIQFQEPPRRSPRKRDGK